MACANGVTTIGGWIASAGWAGVEINDFPALQAWEDRMAERPGVEKGRHVPDRHGIKDLLKDKEKMEKHAGMLRRGSTFTFSPTANTRSRYLVFEETVLTDSDCSGKQEMGATRNERGRRET